MPIFARENPCAGPAWMPVLLTSIFPECCSSSAKNWNVNVKSRLEQASFRVWSALIQNPRLYDWFLKTAFVGQKFLPGKKHMISKLPFAGGGWTRSRDLKKITGRRFIHRIKS